MRWKEMGQTNDANDLFTNVKNLIYRLDSILWVVKWTKKKY